MRVFIQDRDVGQLEVLERSLRDTGHEPVVIYSLTEILDMASHPHLIPDAILAEAAVIRRTLGRLGEATAATLIDLLARPLVIATGPSDAALPVKVNARLPRPIPVAALGDLLSDLPYEGQERRGGSRRARSDVVEIHLYNGGSYGPYTARFYDLSPGGACVRIPAGSAVPERSPDATADIWVHEGPLGATRLHGRIAWVDIPMSNSETRVGVEFASLSDAARTRIRTALTA